MKKWECRVLRSYEVKARTIEEANEIFREMIHEGSGEVEIKGEERFFCFDHIIVKSLSFEKSIQN